MAMGWRVQQQGNSEVGTLPGANTTIFLDDMFEIIGGSSVMWTGWTRQNGHGLFGQPSCY